MPQDKANHLAYGMIVYSLVGVWDPLMALGIVVMIATVKEVWDRTGHGTCSIWDWIATVSCPMVIECIRSIV